MSIELGDISSGFVSIAALNNNFQEIEDWINLNALWRQGVENGQANQMNVTLDMNSNPILNVVTDLNDTGSLITVGDADTRYVNTSGDTMSGPLTMAGNPVYVRAPVSGNEPSRKQDLDEERTQRINADVLETNQRKTADNKEMVERKAGDAAVTQGYQSADANIQAQLTGEVPLEASAFSPISWHSQSINNSVEIPNNVNAWSFGPSMTISMGASVTIGEGSSWTIANGELNE